VHTLEAPREGTPRLIAVEGLPPMGAIAGTCGLSQTKQVWCWGRLEATDGPAFRAEQQPVVPLR
jgi:hypothetical protein